MDFSLFLVFYLDRFGSVLDTPLANQLKGHAAVSDELRLSNYEEMIFLFIMLFVVVLLVL